MGGPYNIPHPGTDYNIDKSALSLTFPAGAPRERCITVDIVSDATYLEPRETIRVFFEMMPLDVLPGPTPQAIVVINDNHNDCKC